MKFKLIVSERNTTQRVRLKEWVQFNLYRLADYVVPNSYSQSKFITRHFPWLIKKNEVITNFTDIEHFIPSYEYVGGSLKVLTTARVASQKNVMRYLDAIDLLKRRGFDNIHFDWFGDVQKGQEEYGQEVLKKVKELGIEDMITFHPATLNILDHYQNCDVFCLPSNYEGFPNVLCEAMSCGKPVVCSRVCDNPYIVKEGENALMFDQTSVEDIADKLQQICSMSQEDRSRWGHRSREIAEMILSSEVFVNKYIEIIENSSK